MLRGCWAQSRMLRLLVSVVAYLIFVSVPETSFGQTKSKSGQIAPKTTAAARMRALNNSLLNFHARLQESSASEVAAIRGEAAKVIAQRAAAFAALIQEDPHSALSFAFSPELLADLAAKFPDSASQLESHATVTGSIERWIFDDADLKSSRSLIQMEARQQRFNLYFAGHEPPNLQSGDTVQATGVFVWSAMAVSSTVVMPSSTSTTTSTNSPSCSTTGVQNTAVLLVNFQDAAISVTPQQANDVFFDASTGRSLNGFWQEASYGQTSAAGSVFGPYTIGPSSSYSCLNLLQVFNDAVAAATTSGVNLQNYTRIDLVFPGLSCGWAGVTATGSAGAGCQVWNTPSGTLTSSLSYLLASYFNARDQGVQLVAHENGHQLGLSHAGTINDEPTAVLGPTTSPGSTTEFNDFFSTMGAWTLGLYSAPHKSEVLNWMASGANYQLVQSSGTYTLQPLETNPPGLQALKVQRGTSNPGDYLWIEYRQPIGNYDSTIAFMNFSGALIHYEDPTTGWFTHVLDFTPADVGSWYNTVLAPGQTWTDPYSNVSISVLSATPSGVTVSVNYGATPCTSGNPSVSVSPLDPTIYPGQSASYSVSVVNNDTSGCSSSTINLGSSQPSGWSTSLSSSSVTLGPGQSASVAMGKGAPSGTAPGTYAVDASAASGSLNGSGTANATVVSPPSLSVGLSVPSSTYSRKNTVPITASVMSGGTPASGLSVTFTLITASGSKVTQAATTGSNGTATWNYKLSPKSSTGMYSVTAQASLSSTGAAASNTISFTVQ